MVRFKSRYFLVAINLPTKTNWKPFSSKRLQLEVKAAIAKYFGDFGVGSVQQSLAVKYYCDTTQHFIVRCCREHLHILQATLALISTINGSPCSLQVHHSAGRYHTRTSTERQRQRQRHRERERERARHRTREERRDTMCICVSA